MRYRSEIDGLRALAVVPVILFHAGIETFGGGFVGVDVFLVISGYLITSILLEDLRSGTFSIVHFYERRARRILPALFLIMLLSLPFAWLWLIPDDMKSFSESLTAVSFFVSNILFWQQSGYFDTATELKPLIHTWSLSVEEQFYVLFPLLLLATWRLGKKWVLSLLGITSVISLSAAQYGAYHYPNFTFFMLPTRAWELSIGAFVAFWTFEKGVRNYRHSLAQFGSLVGLTLIVFAVFGYGKETPFPSFYALAPTIGAALIIIFATHETWTGKLLGSKPFVWIGLISYSAYLWHQPLFAFSRTRNLEEPSATLMLSLATATIVLAYLSWRYVERPFRNRHRFTRNQVFLFGLIGSVIFAAIGIAGYISNGWAKFRMSETQLGWLETARPSPKRRACHTGGEHYLKPENACEYFGHRVTWAVFGDSHAVELAYAMASELSADDIGVKHLSFSACAPSFNIAGSETPCGKWTDEAIAYLGRTPTIKNVVVSYRLNYHMFGSHEKFYPSLPNEVPASRQVEIWKSYIKLLLHLRDSGKQVVVVLQAPELNKRVGFKIFNADISSGDIISVPGEWWQRRNKHVTEHLGEIPHGITVVNPADLFCDRSDCYATRNGISNYFDGDHMSVAGAGIVSRHILKFSR